MSQEKVVLTLHCFSAVMRARFGSEDCNHLVSLSLLISLDTPCGKLSKDRLALPSRVCSKCYAAILLTGFYFEVFFFFSV